MSEASNLYAYGGEGSAAKGKGVPADMEDHGRAPKVGYGKVPPRRDERLLPFDPYQAARENIPYTVTTNWLMATTDARAALINLMDRAGVLTKTEGVQQAFMEGVLLAHTKNSASQVAPDRATITIGEVGNQTTYNYYLDVMAVLAGDARRFFRAYADYTKQVNLKVLAKRGTTDPAEVRDIEDIMHVARERGMEREPALCFDSADACTGLTSMQYRMIAVGKALATSKGYNPVDTPMPLQAGAVIEKAGGLAGAKKVVSNDGAAMAAPGY